MFEYPSYIFITNRLIHTLEAFGVSHHSQVGNYWSNENITHAHTIIHLLFRLFHTNGLLYVYFSMMKSHPKSPIIICVIAIFSRTVKYRTAAYMCHNVLRCAWYIVIDCSQSTKNTNQSQCTQLYPAHGSTKDHFGGHYDTH